MKKGSPKLVLGIVVLLVIIAGVVCVINKWQFEPKVSPVADDRQVWGDLRRGTEISFERAINANDWIALESYLSDNVLVVLDGSSCCGDKSAGNAITDLKRVSGLSFTFDPNSNLVKEYLNSQKIDYPEGRQLNPNLYFSDLKIGVEDDPAQPHKAVIGYKLENGKAIVLFVSPGRDRF